MYNMFSYVRKKVNRVNTNNIKVGDKLQIHCYKHDGSLHRTWDEAIVLDTVGAGMELQPSDNGLQRYDIFIAGKEYAFGKMRGTILE